ncbi:zinc-binding protein A33 [Eutrema salsugineum]|uniref:zinc-binding protein A33 n=1 Tax=Eutrema salsugineum TaxID=72664 RepID=UPI000CED3A50|nr:zinc-binding protein A33 [Eutrema salsugineum]
MSDYDEPKTPFQEFQTPEQESKSQQGEIAKTTRKRTLDEDEDEDPENQCSKLDVVAKKSTARKLEFERTEEEAVEKEDGVAKKPTARKLEFERSAEEDDALPLACSICRKPFLDPIVTRCYHYFCKHCALKHHEKNVNCFVCDKPTLGFFKTAVKVKKKIAKLDEFSVAMVKEVSTMVAKAAVMMKNANAMSAESAEIVEEVETMVEMVETYGAESAEDPSSWDSVVRMVENMEEAAADAREMAEKAAEMIQVANATTETARAAMAKALMVMKKVKWNR